MNCINGDWILCRTCPPNDMHMYIYAQKRSLVITTQTTAYSATSNISTTYYIWVIASCVLFVCGFCYHIFSVSSATSHMNYYTKVVVVRSRF